MGIHTYGRAGRLRAGRRLLVVAFLMMASQPSAPTERTNGRGPGGSAHPPRFKLVPLGERMRPNAVNRWLQVVGEDKSCAALWTKGVITHLARPWSEAIAINDSGVCVGNLLIGDGIFVYRDGDLQELRDGLRFVYGVNRRGEMAVTSVDVGHVFLVDRYGKTDLTARPHSPEVMMIGGLNDNGEVVGSARGDATQSRAVVFRRWGATFLPGLPGYPYSHASATDNSGRVVGRVSTYKGVGDDQESRPELWYRGRVTDLGTLKKPANSADATPGDLINCANAINNSGWVVGTSETGAREGSEPVFHAFLWMQGRLYDLNDLVEARGDWVLWYANGLNNAGAIVGEGNKGGFLLIPVK